MASPLLPESLSARLSDARARWLVTGVAGFIGSNLLEALLRAGQEVVGIDDFSTGFRRNLDEVRDLVGEAAWARFRFVEGDIRDDGACADVAFGIDYVLHQAALGSVPRSIEAPLASFGANVDGFVRLLEAARAAGVRRVVYASSSSVYGDSEKLPKVEHEVGRPISPYAATKVADELFAEVWARTYGLSCVGLRYFNVFGPRQDPDGAYAAVIPRWVAAMLRGEAVQVNGDGQTSRDFCYVANAVQANVLAALAPALPSAHEVFNVAVGERATLLELFNVIREVMGAGRPSLALKLASLCPTFHESRPGDVRHSLADVTRAAAMIEYAPDYKLRSGLAETVHWYVERLVV